MTNIQIIWNALTKAGYNEYATAGIIGNIMSESNASPIRIEDDFSAGYMKSQQYTNNVDNGSISEYEFVNSRKGFGICQWTLPYRKQGLYRYAKSCGVSIGDINMQVQFLVMELKTEFYVLNNKLMRVTSIREAAVAFLKDFERPLLQNQAVQDERTENAQQAYNQCKGINKQTQPKTLSMGSFGYKVSALQIMLNGQGYNCGEVDGEFGTNTRNAVVAFQRDNGMTTTGTVDEKMWGLLF